MAQIAIFNKNGVTIIEMMVSLVILLFVSLALLQTSIVGTRTNLKNSLRDEAVNVAEMRTNALKSMKFDNITPGAEAVVSRNLRGFTANFTPTRTIIDIDTDTKQINMTVSWVYSGQTYTHGITTIVRKQ